jgi:hypothetical protein
MAAAAAAGLGFWRWGGRVRRGLGGKEESVVEEHGERIGWARDGESEILYLNRPVENEVN